VVRRQGGRPLVWYKCRVQQPLVAFHRPQIGARERAAADRVLASGALVQGREVEGFEAELSATFEGRHCVAVASGTSALHLGLLAAGIGPGDEVIVPSFTFAATAHAVAHCGAVPVFADIDPATFCIDPAAVSACITSRTAAVIPVHLYGHPAAMGEVDRIAARHDLLLMEDACQAQGAAIGGRPVGALAPMAAVSFYPSKTMTTVEGGLLICEDGAHADAVRALRNQGLGSGRLRRIGYNARMTDVSAAIGRVQLTRVPELLATRRANARRWDAALPTGLVPRRVPGIEHATSVYTIRCDDRARATAVLTAHGIETRVYYDTPLHLTEPYKGSPASLPQAESAADAVLSVPVGPHLSHEDCARIELALQAL
jgi:perosamine synthetase